MSIRKEWIEAKGKSGYMTLYIDIPIAVKYKYTPPEKMTPDYPGCPEDMELSYFFKDEELKGEIKKYIISEHQEDIIYDCKEDMKNG